MESETQSIDVEAPAARVFGILASPATMPAWTNGFVISVRDAGGGVWQLETKRGALAWRVAANADALTVDFYTERDHPGRATYARVLPRDAFSTVMLTMIRWPNIDAAMFAYMKGALATELELIKQLAEAK